MATPTSDQAKDKESSRVSVEVNSKWWYWIAAQPIAMVLIFVFLIAEMFGLALLASLGLVFVYFIGVFAYVADSKAISRAEGVNWHPSGFAYGGLAIFFGLLIAPLYLYQRHKYVGNP